MTHPKNGTKLYSLEAVSEAFDIPVYVLKRAANTNCIGIRNGVTMDEIRIIITRAKARMRKEEVSPNDVLEIVNAFKDIVF